jgi:alginate O-acetyltransferase complex protein AlgI
MTFSSIPFLFYFLPIFTAAYFVLPWRNGVFLAGSLLFYAWGEPIYVFLLIGYLVFNHYAGRLISKAGDGRVLAAAIVFNLLGLFWFKYAGFAADLIGNFLSAELAAEIAVSPHLPLGISFFTFQAISFLVDLYRRDGPPPRSLVDTALYIAIFPQLIAGPIVRYKAIAGQLQRRDHTFEKFSDGARLFILGLSQKMLLANSFAGPADAAFGADPEVMLTAGAAWVGLFAYSLQIFFDFAGYSNMALGMGRMFGLELPRNFDFPYASQSVTEFWRRWHITLSQWFRDYVYIPLGGNRGTAARTYFNLWVVFLLCGLWHGASFAFLLWGALHGSLLVIERAFLGRALAATPRLFRHIYTMFVVVLAWIPFRAPSLAAAGEYCRALVGADDGAILTRVADIAPDGIGAIFAIGALTALWPLARVAGAQAAARLPILRAPMRTVTSAPALRFAAKEVCLIILFVACAAALAGGAYNPFIYYRF